MQLLPADARQPQSLQGKLHLQISLLTQNQNSPLPNHTHSSPIRNNNNSVAGRKISNRYARNNKAADHETNNHYQDIVFNQYQQFNQTFREGLKKLHDSHNLPAMRDQQIKNIETQESQEKKLKRAISENKSVDANENVNELELELSDPPSEVESEKMKLLDEIKKIDRAYGMLDTCTKIYDIKQKQDQEMLKLMERMDLDRPILQKEKYELIFLEQNLHQTIKFEDQIYQEKAAEAYDKIYEQHQPTEKFMENLEQFAERFNNSEEEQKRAPEKEKKKKRLDIKVEEIRRAMVDKMRQRKAENKQQLAAYKNLQEYIKTRFRVEKLMPSRDDIKLLEVLKKIIESGWIIGEDEMKQVIKFLGVT